MVSIYLFIFFVLACCSRHRFIRTVSGILRVCQFATKSVAVSLCRFGMRRLCTSASDRKLQFFVMNGISYFLGALSSIYTVCLSVGILFEVGIALYETGFSVVSSVTARITGVRKPKYFSNAKNNFGASCMGCLSTGEYHGLLQYQEYSHYKRFHRHPYCARSFSLQRPLSIPQYARFFLQRSALLLIRDFFTDLGNCEVTLSIPPEDFLRLFQRPVSLKANHLGQYRELKLFNQPRHY